MPADATSPDLEVLGREHCARLLEDHHFGRLAFWSGDLPLILPVNYVFDMQSIVIRTGPGAKLEQTPLRMVAFEVDDADHDGQWGWSVVAQGPAFDITDSIDEYSELLRALPVEPWAPGARQHWLKVTAARLSGRRFKGGPKVPPDRAEGP